MQTMIRRLLAVLVGLVLLTAGVSLPAQALSTLHVFTKLSGQSYTNSDGYNPATILSLSNNILYGATPSGGDWGWGTLFSVGTDGVAFKTLHSFTALDRRTGTNVDGIGVASRLILTGDYLYGIASQGGYFGGGTLFKLKTDGTGFTNLYHLVPASTTNAGGIASITMSGDVLYGTASRGGDFAVGTLFKINPDGTGFTNLHSFLALSDFQGLGTNRDGAFPGGGLTLSGGSIYGTTAKGGPLGFGTVFKLTTNGTDFAVLHAFSGWDLGSDGAAPDGLLLSDNTLYGTTALGATFDNGDFFTNTDGASPNGGLVLAGDTLYGTTLHSGPYGAATVFAVNTNGTDFTTVHAFAYLGNYDTSLTNSNTIVVYTNSDGIDPVVGLALSSDALYGTTLDGGSGGGGTVFRISFRPTLTLTMPQALLSWPASSGGFEYTGFGLQVATNLNSTPTWTPVSGSPVLIGGTYTTTNPISGGQQFYRLTR